MFAKQTQVQVQTEALAEGTGVTTELEASEIPSSASTRHYRSKFAHILSRVKPSSKGPNRLSRVGEIKKAKEEKSFARAQVGTKITPCEMLSGVGMMEAKEQLPLMALAYVPVRVGTAWESLNPDKLGQRHEALGSHPLVEGIATIADNGARKQPPLKPEEDDSDSTMSDDTVASEVDLGSCKTLLTPWGSVDVEQPQQPVKRTELLSQKMALLRRRTVLHVAHYPNAEFWKYKAYMDSLVKTQQGITSTSVRAAGRIMLIKDGLGRTDAADPGLQSLSSGTR